MHKGGKGAMCATTETWESWGNQLKQGWEQCVLRAKFWKLWWGLLRDAAAINADVVLTATKHLDNA